MDSNAEKKQVDALVDFLFRNGSSEKADRLLLVQEERGGDAKVSNARYLGGYSKGAVRDAIVRILKL